MVGQFSDKDANEERAVFLTNGAGTTGCPCAKVCSWAHTSQHIQKLTQNRLKIRSKS